MIKKLKEAISIKHEKREIVTLREQLELLAQRSKAKECTTEGLDDLTHQMCEIVQTLELYT